MGCSLPPWLRIRLPTKEHLVLFGTVSKNLEKRGLHTVCDEAKCPNKAECWGSGTATFLLMGDICTRNCRFCATKTSANGLSLDENEPSKVAEAVKEMKLTYVVLTSVDRDDLKDFGAGHFAETIQAVKKTNPKVLVEVLIPDFQGDEEALRKVVSAGPEVLGHNIEVVRELQAKARDARASYAQSLKVLSNAKKMNPKLLTKSSLMLGLGETRKQVEKAMDDLRSVGVEALTIGQYLQPSRNCLPVKEFVTPEKFEEMKKTALKKGFRLVASGPFVRSSFKAGELYLKKLKSGAHE